MTRTKLSEEFLREWEAFLTERGHQVDLPKGVTGVLESRDAAGEGFRWLLLSARGKSKCLSAVEIQDIRCHLRRGKRLNQRVYVAIRFQKPTAKVIVMPADRVAARKRILARKGGVPWVE